VFVRLIGERRCHSEDVPSFSWKKNGCGAVVHPWGWGWELRGKQQRREWECAEASRG